MFLGKKSHDAESHGKDKERNFFHKEMGDSSTLIVDMVEILDLWGMSMSQWLKGPAAQRPVIE